MSAWIKIEERKPPQGVFVLVCIYDPRPKVMMNFICIAERHGESFYDGSNGELVQQKGSIVTHWMPLPDFPVDNND